MKTLLLSLALSAACPYAFADGQTIPVPGNLQSAPSTSIQVVGEAGAGQSASTVRMIPLKLDASGNIKRATGTTSPAYKLGQEVGVPAGKYLVTYSASMIEVDVTAGEHKVVELQKVNVPKVDGSYTFKVFEDYTNSEMQDRRAEWMYVLGISLKFTNVTTTTNRWGRVIGQANHDNTKDMTTICAEAKSSLKAGGKKACAGYDSSDYRSMVGNFFTFNADGSDSFTNVSFKEDDSYRCYESAETVTKEARQYDANGIDGDSVSLLPGVYGIEMKNSAGKISSQLGVVLP